MEKTSKNPKPDNLGDKSSYGFEGPNPIKAEIGEIHPNMEDVPLSELDDPII